MKVILFSATAVNGIIARVDGAEDFLSHENWKEFSRVAKRYKCIVFGRNTYEVVRKWKYTFDDIDADKIVLSKDKDVPYPVATSPKNALAMAKRKGHEVVLICGGGKTNGSFMKERLVNELILNVNPVAVGTGIRLFGEEEFDAKLKLLSTRKLKSGILQLRYSVSSR